MTLRELLSVLGRRWYFTVLATLCAAALFASFWAGQGLYATKTVVWFTWPSTSVLSVYNGSTNEDVLAFAGVVATTINRGRDVVRYSSSSAPYYGAGIREGVQVGLRDEGSQWEASVGQSVIELQIVGPTEEWVADRQRDLLGQIDEIARAHQLQAGPDVPRIDVAIEPLTERIDEIVPSRTAKLAAGAALLAAAVLAGGLASVWLDRPLREAGRKRRAGTSRVASIKGRSE